jgi:hypothetical protein
MHLRRRVRALLKILKDPAAWSAERYASSSTMYFAAVRPDTWRKERN